MRKIRIGIIGCGWIACKAHIPAYQKLHSVAIAGLYDLNLQNTLNVAGTLPGAIPYENLSQLLNSDIDAVIITTPNFTHYEIAKEAMMNNKHVLVEKPVTIFPAEVEELIELAKLRNLIFMPGFVSRFRKDIQILKQEIDNNEFGEIREINAGWIRKNGVPRPGTWITNKLTAGGGVLIDLGSHILDICFMLTNAGSEIDNFNLVVEQTLGSIEASQSAVWFEKNETDGSLADVNVDAAINAGMLLNKSINMAVSLSWCSDIEYDSTWFYINFANGSVKMNTLFGFSTNRLFDDFIEIERQGNNVLKIKLSKEETAPDYAFYQMAKTFIDNISGNMTAMVSPEDGLRTVSAINNLYNTLV
jgi:predicted dehydrogenase